MTTDGPVTLAASLRAMLLDDLSLRDRRRPVIGVAGESGSGKSVTADTLARAFDDVGLPCIVLHQDDYFRLPPRTNHEHREIDLAHVGPHEVALALLQSHIAAFRAARNVSDAPRVDYPGNRFVLHPLDLASHAMLIVEGTYVLTLDDLDVRIFLDATHDDTRERRRARNRDIDAPFVDQVLAIEHAIIARQAEHADIVIDREFTVTRRP